MSNTITTDYAHPRATRRKRPHSCHVCATCYNFACPVKQHLPLLQDIDCGALFRVLDKQGFVCERQVVPVEARV